MSRSTTAARSDTGRVREGNEDRYLVREERGAVLLAVADGVGGASGGEVAADAALAELAGRFFAAQELHGPTNALTRAVRDANAAVLSAAGASGHREAASTLVAAAIRRDEAVVANLGDSRAYLIRDGDIRQLTQDHAGLMAHAITRFVGDPRGVQPDVFVETLRPNDRLLLCSDGLTRHVSPEEIAAMVAGRDVRTAADTLVDLANARGGEDNITVIVYAARRRPLVPGPPGRVLALAVLALLVAAVLVGSVGALLLAGGRAQPSIAPTPSAAPTATPTETPAASPTETPPATPTSPP